MKTKKLLKKIKAFLSADQRAQVAKADFLDKVLHKLKKKESALREDLKAEKDSARRKEIVRKLEVVEAQRKKGVKLEKKLEPLRDND